MITVIIAGGSGTRLWPLSTPSYPKHLLSLTGTHSLLQHTYERAQAVGNTVYVLTEASHAQHVKKQLPDLGEGSFIIEPARRGTASCILAALNHIGSRHDTKEPIAFLAADHYVRDTAGFAHSFKTAEAVSKAQARIVLIGVEPDFPATGFGYIQKDGLFDENLFVFNVHSFKEKPNYELAKEYVASGNYLWNSGYFVGSVSTFLAAMQKDAPQLYTEYERLAATKTADDYKETYLSLENVAIDYALIEKVDNLLVVPASFDWMDLGSYSDLHKAVESDEKGNHVRGNAVEIEGVENSFIQNHEDKPVAVIGLDNVVVINSPEGILVARKDLAQQVGEVSKRISSKESK
jgi:mannose-1-phosphate guanylyltransferase/mannose-6-phosphate isomerase